MADHFLLKSSNRAGNCLALGSGLAIDAHSTLTEVLTSRIGPEAARMFAEPLVSRDKSGQTVQVAWYGPQVGEARPLADLDAAARRLAEDRLHVMVSRIEALVREAALAPLIRACLTLTSSADILTVDGFPVLVNWGISGPAWETRWAAICAPRRLTRLQPLRHWPRRRRPAARPPPGRVLPLPGPGSLGQHQLCPPPPPLHDNQLPRIAWVPLVVLLTLAARTLLWVLWPGTRIFPDTTATAISPQVVDGVSRA